MSETVAGILFIALGIMEILIALLGSYSVRRFFLLVICFVWGIVLYGFISSSLTTSAIDIIFVLISAWAFWRIGEEIKRGNGL